MSWTNLDIELSAIAYLLVKFLFAAEWMFLPSLSDPYKVLMTSKRNRSESLVLCTVFHLFYNFDNRRRSTGNTSNSCCNRATARR